MKKFNPSILTFSISKSLVGLSAILILCNYYYLYLYEFDQGVSSSPAYYSLIKLLSVFVFVTAFFDFKLRLNYSIDKLMLLFFLLFSVAFFIIKNFYYSYGDYLYLNVIFCLAPFVTFKMKEDINLVIYFFEVCLWLVIFQTSLDLYINIMDISLWGNSAFVGGLGNPSSFGVFCNIVLAYILFVRKHSIMSLLSIFPIIFSIISTQSLFSLIGMLCVFSYFIWSKSKILLALFLLTIITFFPFAMTLIPEHLSYKLESLSSLFTDSDINVSQSVAVRLDIHSLFLDKIAEDFFYVLVFGYNDLYYYSADSQFLSFFGSFGVVFSFLFFFPVFFYLIKSKVKSGVDRFFYISMFLFFVMFFFNRIIDYYPMALILFLFLFFPRKNSITPLNKEYL